MKFEPEPELNETKKNVSMLKPETERKQVYLTKTDDTTIKKGNFASIIYNEHDLNEVVHTILTALQNVSNVRYYGTALLVDVLCGTMTKKVLNAKLNTIPEFGKLDTMSKEELNAVINWLITKNYMLKTKGQYPVLHPTYNGIHYDEQMTVNQLKQLKKYLES